MIKLAQLIEDLDTATLTGDGAVEISHLEYDSRLTKPGSLFIAVRGFKVDGYDYVAEAVANGAIAVLGEKEACDAVANHVMVPNVRPAMATVAARFYGYPGKKIKACGVTGTNGKTTTCFLIKNIFEARNKKTGLITSQLYDTGKEKFAAERTTPESLDVQRLLYLMKGNHCVNVVLEVSSHALMLNRVDNIDFRVAVYTNLTRDHLDFHQTMEKYAEAKLRLAAHLEGELSYAVINLDVDEFRPLFGNMKSSHMSYSVDNDEADIYCANYELKPEGTIFDLVTPMGTHTVDFKLPGKFNLVNALAAAGGGLAGGVDIDNVVRGLESSQPVPGRLQPIVAGQPFAVYADYAHTPDALARVCEAVRELTTGRLLLLFGCGGDRDRGKRPLMAQAAISHADYVMVTTDNPRSEEPEAIVEEIKPGLSGDRFAIELDRSRAIEAILRRAEPGDAVILAGKGAETVQEIHGEKLPFSDLTEAQAALTRLGYKPANPEEET